VGGLYDSQAYGLPRHVTGRASPFSSLQCKAFFSSEADSGHNNILPDTGSDKKLARPLQSSKLNVLVQIVVANSCCCQAYNGYDFLQCSQLSTLGSCIAINPYRRVPQTHGKAKRSD
jgi:hypothetical protein